jgi:hypothetical protein
VSAVTAGAAPLPPPDATVIGDVVFNTGGRQDLNTFGSIGLSATGVGSVGFTASAAPLPTLTAIAQIGPNGQLPSLFGRADGLMTYSFEILGPADSVPVLIDVAGAASAESSPGGSFAVVSLWQLFDSAALSTVLAGDEIRSGQLSGSFSQDFGRTVSLTLATNHFYPIFLLADSAAAATDAGSRATASAFVDPRLSFGLGVDPFAFSFVFSAGIGNGLPAPSVGEVPEPGTIALLSAAALSVGWLRRRRSDGAGSKDGVD